MSFEGSNPFYGGKVNNGSVYERLVTDQFGGMALEITPKANGWFGFTNAQVIVGNVKKLRIVYTSNVKLSVAVGYYKGKPTGEFNGWKDALNKATFEVGTGEFILEFAESIDIIKSVQFNFVGSNVTRIQIHEIYAVAE